MTEAKTWTHRGITIELLESTGKFRAVLNGKPAVCSSMDAMKKRIDQEADDPNKFQPFQAYRLFSGDQVVRVEVIGTQTVRKRLRSEIFWTCKNHSTRGESAAYSVIRSGEEVDKMVEAFRTLVAENKKKRDAMDDEERLKYEELEALEERPK